CAGSLHDQMDMVGLDGPVDHSKSLPLASLNQRGSNSLGLLLGAQAAQGLHQLEGHVQGVASDHLGACCMTRPTQWPALTSGPCPATAAPTEHELGLFWSAACHYLRLSNDSALIYTVGPT